MSIKNATNFLRLWPTIDCTWYVHSETVFYRQKNVQKQRIQSLHSQNSTFIGVVLFFCLVHWKQCTIFLYWLMKTFIHLMNNKMLSFETHQVIYKFHKHKFVCRFFLHMLKNALMPYLWNWIYRGTVSLPPSFSFINFVLIESKANKMKQNRTQKKITHQHYLSYVYSPKK